MPRVPVLQQQERLHPLPGPTVSSNASPALLGGITAKQLENTGEDLLRGGVVMQRMEADEQERVNDVRVTDAVNKGMGAKLRLTHDPQEGYSNLRGVNALERPEGKSLQEEYETKLQTNLDEIENGLGNPLQKERFREQSQRIMMQYRAGIQQHVSRAFTEHHADVMETKVKLGQQQMGLDFDNPALVGQAANGIRDSVYKSAKAVGKSDDWIRVATAEAISPGHLAVIKSATDAGQMEYAKKYAEGIKHELTLDAQGTVDKTLNAGDFEARTQGYAETYMSKTKGNFSEAIKLARADLSGKDEDATVTRIKVQETEHRQRKENYQRDNRDAAWKQLVANGYDISKVSPSLKAGMDGQELAAMERTANAEREGGVKTDPDAYYTLSRAMVADPEKFVQTDIRNYYDKLSPTDRKHFMDKQADLAKKGHEDITSTSAQIGTMIKKMDLKGSDAGIFHMVADDSLQAAQISKGVPLTQGERQKILDGLVIEGYTGDNNWYNSSTRFYQAKAENKPFGHVEWSEEQYAMARKILKLAEDNDNPTVAELNESLRRHYGMPIQ